MNYVDSAVLDLTEWLCRRFQRLTGRTNVWLAVQLTNLSIIVYFVWAGVYFWSSDIGSRVALGLFCSGLLYVLTQTIFKEPIEAYENDAYRRVAKGYRNPRRVRDAPLRISFLTLSFALFGPIALALIRFRVRIALLSYSLIVLTTIVLYLLACDPLPPCAARLKQWLRRSAPSRLAAPESPGAGRWAWLPAARGHGSRRGNAFCTESRTGGEVSSSSSYPCRRERRRASALLITMRAFRANPWSGNSVAFNRHPSLVALDGDSKDARVDAIRRVVGNCTTRQQRVSR